MEKQRLKMDRKREKRKSTKATSEEERTLRHWKRLSRITKRRKKMKRKKRKQKKRRCRLRLRRSSADRSVAVRRLWRRRQNPRASGAVAPWGVVETPVKADSEGTPLTLIMMLVQQIPSQPRFWPRLLN